MLEQRRARWPARHLFTHVGTWNTGQADAAKYANCSVRHRHHHLVHPQGGTWELYDLKTDPNEFTNLAEDVKYAEIKTRLTAALQQWRRQTKDPYLDPKKLARFTAEIEEVNRRYPGLRYRRDPKFEWEYPKYLDPEAKTDPDAAKRGK